MGGVISQYRRKIGLLLAVGLGLLGLALQSYAVVNVYVYKAPAATNKVPEGYGVSPYFVYHTSSSSPSAPTSVTELVPAAEGMKQLRIEIGKYFQPSEGGHTYYVAKNDDGITLTSQSNQKLVFSSANGLYPRINPYISDSDFDGKKTFTVYTYSVGADGKLPGTNIATWKVHLMPWSSLKLPTSKSTSSSSGDGSVGKWQNIKIVNEGRFECENDFNSNEIFVLSNHGYSDKTAVKQDSASIWKLPVSSINVPSNQIKVIAKKGTSCSSRINYVAVSYSYKNSAGITKTVNFNGVDQGEWIALDEIKTEQEDGSEYKVINIKWQPLENPVELSKKSNSISSNTTNQKLLLSGAIQTKQRFMYGTFSVTMTLPAHSKNNADIVPTFMGYFFNKGVASSQLDTTPGETAATVGSITAKQLDGNALQLSWKPKQNNPNANYLVTIYSKNTGGTAIQTSYITNQKGAGVSEHGFAIYLPQQNGYYTVKISSYTGNYDPKNITGTSSLTINSSPSFVPTSQTWHGFSFASPNNSNPAVSNSLSPYYGPDGMIRPYLSSLEKTLKIGLYYPGESARWGQYRFCPNEYDAMCRSAIDINTDNKPGMPLNYLNNKRTVQFIVVWTPQAVNYYARWTPAGNYFHWIGEIPIKNFQAIASKTQPFQHLFNGAYVNDGKAKQFTSPLYMAVGLWKKMVGVKTSSTNQQSSIVVEKMRWTPCAVSRTALTNKAGFNFLPDTASKSACDYQDASGNSRGQWIGNLYKTSGEREGIPGKAITWDFSTMAVVYKKSSTIVALLSAQSTEGQSAALKPIVINPVSELAKQAGTAFFTNNINFRTAQTSTNKSEENCWGLNKSGLCINAQLEDTAKLTGATQHIPNPGFAHDNTTNFHQAIVVINATLHSTPDNDSLPKGAYLSSLLPTHSPYLYLGGKASDHIVNFSMPMHYINCKPVSNSSNSACEAAWYASSIFPAVDLSHNSNGDDKIKTLLPTITQIFRVYAPDPKVVSSPGYLYFSGAPKLVSLITATGTVNKNACQVLYPATGEAVLPGQVVTINAQVYCSGIPSKPINLAVQPKLKLGAYDITWSYSGSDAKDLKFNVSWVDPKNPNKPELLGCTVNKNSDGDYSCQVNSSKFAYGMTYPAGSIQVQAENATTTLRSPWVNMPAFTTAPMRPGGTGGKISVDTQKKPIELTWTQPDYKPGYSFSFVSESNPKGLTLDPAAGTSWCSQVTGADTYTCRAVVSGTDPSSTYNNLELKTTYNSVDSFKNSEPFSITTGIAAPSELNISLGKVYDNGTVTATLNWTQQDYKAGDKFNLKGAGGAIGNQDLTCSSTSCSATVKLQTGYYYPKNTLKLTASNQSGASSATGEYDKAITVPVLRPSGSATKQTKITGTVDKAGDNKATITWYQKDWRSGYSFVLGGEDATDLSLGTASCDLLDKDKNKNYQCTATITGLVVGKDYKALTLLAKSPTVGADGKLLASKPTDITMGTVAPSKPEMVYGQPKPSEDQPTQVTIKWDQPNYNSGMVFAIANKFNSNGSKDDGGFDPTVRLQNTKASDICKSKNGSSTVYTCETTIEKLWPDTWYGGSQSLKLQVGLNSTFARTEVFFSTPIVAPSIDKVTNEGDLADGKIKAKIEWSQWGYKSNNSYDFDVVNNKGDSIPGVSLGDLTCTSSGDCKAPINGLEQGKTYQLVIKTTKTIGDKKQVKSSSVYTYSPSWTLPKVPSNVKITEVGLDAVTINWTQSDYLSDYTFGVGIPVENMGLVGLKISKIDSSKPWCVKEDGDNYSCMAKISGLQIAHTYNNPKNPADIIQIYTIAPKGKSADGKVLNARSAGVPISDKSFTTKLKAPTDITATVVKNLKNNKATLEISWKQLGLKNGYGFTVQYSNGSDKGSKTLVVGQDGYTCTKDNICTTTLDDHGFEQGTSYTIKVTGFYPDNNNEATAQIIYSVPIVKPVGPSNVNAVLEGNDVEITWDQKNYLNQYNFKYKINGGSEQSITTPNCKVDPTNPDEATDCSVLIKNLQPGKNYSNIMISASGDNTNAVWAKVPAVTTAPAAPTNFKVTPSEKRNSDGSVNVTLSWSQKNYQAPSSDGAGDGYQFSLTENGKALDSKLITCIPGIDKATCMVNLDGTDGQSLEPGKKYTFDLQASYAGKSSSVVSGEFVAPQVILIAPVLQSVTEVTQDSAVVTWEQSNYLNENQFNLQLNGTGTIYKLNSSDITCAAVGAKTGLVSCSYTLSNDSLGSSVIKSNTSYTVAVQGSSGANSSAWSKSLSFATLLTAPTDLSAPGSQHLPNRTELTWNQAGYYGSKSVTYQLIAKLNGQIIANAKFSGSPSCSADGAASCSAIVTGLPGNTQGIELSVVATGVAGKSVSSSTSVVIATSGEIQMPDFTTVEYFPTYSMISIGHKEKPAVPVANIREYSLKKPGGGIYFQGTTVTSSRGYYIIKPSVSVKAGDLLRIKVCLSGSDQVCRVSAWMPISKAR